MTKTSPFAEVPPRERESFFRTDQSALLRKNGSGTKEQVHAFCSQDEYWTAFNYWLVRAWGKIHAVLFLRFEMVRSDCLAQRRQSPHSFCQIIDAPCWACNLIHCFTLLTYPAGHLWAPLRCLPRKCDVAIISRFSFHSILETLSCSSWADSKACHVKSLGDPFMWLQEISMGEAKVCTWASVASKSSIAGPVCLVSCRACGQVSAWDEAQTDGTRLDEHKKKLSDPTMSATMSVTGKLIDVKEDINLEQQA